MEKRRMQKRLKKHRHAEWKHKKESKMMSEINEEYIAETW
jgi:hypothetical protein